MDENIAALIKKKTPCFFISPHLDDAALSCGGLIAKLAGKTPVTVLTVFTEARSDFYTLSAKKALIDSGFSNAEALYIARKKEDTQAFQPYSVSVLHMGKVESLYRLLPHPTTLHSLVSRFLPEALHIYPTYRFHIQKGIISPQDKALITSIAQVLKTSVPEDAAVFAPYGVGGHIDHLVVRQAVEAVFRPILWLDQPYLLREAEQIGKETLPKGFHELKVDQKRKKSLVETYTSQISLLFSGMKQPEIPEFYRFPQK